MKCLINKFTSLILCLALFMLCGQLSFAEDSIGTSPDISVSGLNQGDVFDKDKDFSFEIDAIDSDGDFKKIVCYLDGENYCESTVVPHSVTISSSTPGKHTITLCAEDEAGNKSSKEIIFYSTGTSSVVKVDTDFTGYTGGSSVGEGMSTTSNDGYQEAVTIDTAHGTSVSIGADGNTSGYGPSVGVTMDGTTGLINMEFDMYIPAKAATLKIMARAKSTKSYLNIAGFSKAGRMYMYGTGGEAPFNNKKYETGVWYRIKLVLDGKTNKYDLYGSKISYGSDGNRIINFETYAKGRYGENYTKVPDINTMRLFVTTSNNEAGNIVIDNLYTKLEEQMPYITGVSSVIGSDASSGVLYNAEKLVIKLSDAISEGDITDYISITDEISDVNIEYANYDSEYGGIVVVPKGKLNSNLEHKITLKAGLPVSASFDLGYDLSETFITSAKDYDVSKGEFITSGNNVKFAVDATNNSGQNQNIIVILSAWKGDTLVAISAADAVLSDGQTVKVNTGSINKGDSDRVEAYAVYGLTDSRPISNKIWIME